MPLVEYTNVSPQRADELSGFYRETYGVSVNKRVDGFHTTYISFYLDAEMLTEGEHNERVRDEENANRER